MRAFTQQAAERMSMNKLDPDSQGPGDPVVGRIACVAKWCLVSAEHSRVFINVIAQNVAEYRVRLQIVQ